VTEAVHSAHVDEETVIGDIGNRTFDDLPFFELGTHLFTEFITFFLEDCPTGDHNIISLLVKLENFELH